ncbi:MAG: sigma-54 dependent transcriptional regulator [Pyrinomonadaceae bacterium]
MSSDANVNVLVVEDEELMRNILRELLEGEGYSVLTADSAETALEIFPMHEIAVTISDIKMKGMNGIDLLDSLKTIDESAIVIIITAYSSVDTAISALRKGAYDYVTKPFVNEDLLQRVRNAIRTRLLFNENRQLRRELGRKSGFSEIIGKSEAIQSVFRLVEKVAGASASILIQGESGTGKELVARAIHTHSPNNTEPFLAVNCGAIPAELLESELFGHVKGAFTNAHRDHKGLFIEAGSGTLLLDEIGEMPLALQVKLLRVLQEQEVRPVGGTTSHPVSARILAATNRNLEKEVAEGRFREDLYYRLNVVEINIPPLRNRREDIPLLIRHFIAKSGDSQSAPGKTISDSALSALTAYRWPGNVRELENAIERASILSEDSIGIEHLPNRIRTEAGSSYASRDSDSFLPTLEETERRYILEILASAENDKAKAANILGIDLSTLYRKLKKFNEV